MAIDAGTALALSSDAHEPDQIGHRYEEAIDLLGSLGVSEIAVFEHRQRRMEPLA
jgi:histidinol-phosphatase (PHP family)